MQAAPLRSLFCRRLHVRRFTPCSTLHVTLPRIQGPRRKEESYVSQRGSLLRPFATKGEHEAGAKFCRECRNVLKWCIPPGDSRERLICQRCGFIEYRNPKLVVGCIVEHEDRILLCSRAIEPCKGLWSFPAGYLEIGESTASGAARETLEEANAAVTVTSMFSMMDVPVIGQCHIMFRAQLDAPFHFSPGVETLQTKLVVPEEIPHEQMAFTSMLETLKAYKADRKLGRFRFHHGVISRRRDAKANDRSGYKLIDYLVQ